MEILVKVLYKCLGILARFAKNFSFGPKYADYEAIY